MNIRFYNARILTETMDITEGELWVRGNTICYIGDGAVSYTHLTLPTIRLV